MPIGDGSVKNCKLSWCNTTRRLFWRRRCFKVDPREVTASPGEDEIPGCWARTVIAENDGSGRRYNNAPHHSTAGCGNRSMYDGCTIASCVLGECVMCGRDSSVYTQGDSDVVSMPAGFRRHLVGKTLINVFTVISPKYALLASWWLTQTFS